MTSKKSILFFGELADGLHGVSISNRMNCKLLSKNFDVSCVEEENSFGAGTTSKFLALLKFNSHILKLRRKARSAKYDVFYYVFSNSILGLIKSYLVVHIVRSQIPNCKIVTHIHRGDVLDNNYSVLFNKLCRHVLDLSCLIICLSESQKQTLCLSSDTPVQVLNNTIDEKNIFNNSTSIDQTDLEIPKTPLRLMVIANYLDSKNIFYFAEYVQHSKHKEDIVVDFYGNYTDKYSKNVLNDYAAQFTNINFLGPLDNQDKYIELTSHDYLVIPSTNEGLPLVLLEAMAVGCPVITTKAGFIQDVLGIDYELYFNEFNTSSVNETINKALSMEKKNIISLAYKSQEHYWRIYSNKCHSESLLRIFDELVNE